MPTEAEKFALERTKLAVDSIKHITTLATGTILLIVAVVDKAPRPVMGRPWLIISIACMVGCLFASFVYLMGAGVLGQNIQYGRNIFRNLARTVYYTFAFGLLSLAAFAVSDLIIRK
jgi:hypothetical protein